MKREALIRWLHKHGCVLIREGSKHSVFFNPKNNLSSTVPRHNEIDDFLAKKIKKDLGFKNK